MTNRWILDVVEDPDTGDAIITFPEDFLEQTGWKEGDNLKWTDLGNGSWSLTKQDVTEQDLIDELERRGRGLEIADTGGTELVEKIFELRRVGKNFDKELDQLIYVVTGRIL